jgi:protein-disulfide isomerase
MKWTGWICLLALAVASAGCERVEPSGPPSEAVRAEIEQRVPEYYKKAFNLSPTVSIKVTDVAAAEVPGMLSATMEMSQGTQTKKYPLVLTRDGRWAIQGQFADITADPFKAVAEKIATKDYPVRGNPNAAVTIVEYSDFQCPFCARAYTTLEEQVLKEYGDKVRVIFKNFPLTSIHPWAETAALASACVRQQSPDGFWKLYDFLFQHQKEITLDNLKEKAQGVVRDAGLDVGQFDACFDNKTLMDAVKAEMAEATAVGVRSTPTFFINGRKFEGALPYDQFKTALDTALGIGSPTPTSAPAG